MDPSLLAMLFGSTGLPNIQAGIEPNSWLPAPVPATAATVPMPAPQTPYPETPRVFPPLGGQASMSPYQESYRSEPYQAPVPSLGATLEPQVVPMPRPRPAGAPQGGEAAPSSTGGDALLKTLRGVQAPAPPQVQRVSTPNLPALRPIQSGGFMDLLASLGIGPQQALPGLKLPSTLGQALGGR